MAVTRNMARKRSPYEEYQENVHRDGLIKKSDGGSIWSRLTALDEKYSRAFAVCASKDSSLSVFRPVMKLLEISCHGIPWIFGTLILLLSVHRAQDVEILLNLFTALMVDIVVIVILKTLFRRGRPEHNQMDMFATVSIDNYSFPSGHATRATMVMCFFVRNIVTTNMNAFLMVLWAISVCLSRVILGRHHLSDVMCGFMIGFVNYMIAMYLWVPRDTCLELLELYFSHFHL